MGEQNLNKCKWNQKQTKRTNGDESVTVACLKCWTNDAVCSGLYHTYLTTFPSLSTIRIIETHPHAISQTNRAPTLKAGRPTTEWTTFRRWALSSAPCSQKWFGQTQTSQKAWKTSTFPVCLRTTLLAQSQQKLIFFSWCETNFRNHCGGRTGGVLHNLWSTSAQYKHHNSCLWSWYVSQTLLSPLFCISHKSHATGVTTEMLKRIVAALQKAPHVIDMTVDSLLLSNHAFLHSCCTRFTTE